MLCKVICSSCGKRSSVDLGDGGIGVRCLACGEHIPIPIEDLQHSDDIPLAEVSDEIDDETLPRVRKRRREKLNQSSGKSQRLLIAGSPAWAWAIVFYLFGAISAGGVVTGIFLYHQNGRDNSFETTKTNNSKSADQAKLTTNPNGTTQQPDPHFNNAGLPPGVLRPVPEAKAENGWPLYIVAEEGFALAIPPNWRQVDLNPTTFDANIQELLRQNPQLGGILGGFQKQVLGSIKFFGFDESSFHNGFSANLNVTHLPAPDDATLDTVATELLAQMEKVPTITKPISHERVKIGEEESEWIRFRVTQQLPARQKQEISFTQVVLFSTNGIHVLTMGTPSDREGVYAPIFEKIGQNFRLVRRRDRD